MKTYLHYVCLLLVACGNVHSNEGEIKQRAKRNARSKNLSVAKTLPSLQSGDILRFARPFLNYGNYGNMLMSKFSVLLEVVVDFLNVLL